MTEPRSLELRASDAERERALELIRESVALSPKRERLVVEVDEWGEPTVAHVR